MELSDRIDKYVKGQMTPEESAAFEQEMESNSSLRAQVSFTQKVVGALSEQEEMRKKMRQWKRDEIRQKWIRVVEFSAAAVVVLGLFLFIAQPHYFGSDPFENHIRSGGELSVDSLLQSGKYDEALRAIDSEVAEVDSIMKTIDKSKEEGQYDYDLQKAYRKHLKKQRKAIMRERRHQKETD